MDSLVVDENAVEIEEGRDHGAPRIARVARRVDGNADLGRAGSRRERRVRRRLEPLS
jgi:hypothetical protein